MKISFIHIDRKTDKQKKNRKLLFIICRQWNGANKLGKLLDKINETK